MLVVEVGWSWPPVVVGRRRGTERPEGIGSGRRLREQESNLCGPGLWGRAGSVPSRNREWETKGGVVGLFRVSRANGHASARACMHSPQYVRGYPDPPGTLADGADGTVG